MTRVIAIVGSSQGIGLELVRQYSADPNTTVHAGDRYLSEQLLGLQATRPNVRAYLADVTDPAALNTMASTIPRVDLLLMVAGVIGPRSPLLGRPPTDDPVASDLLRVFSVNVIGSWNVVDAFQAKMGRGGKIMLMTSSFASMERTTHAQAPSYSIAKASMGSQAGVNMLGRKLAVELKDRGIDVVLMSPGVVRTEIAGWVGEIEPEESAACIRQELEREGTNGQFLRYDGNGLPW